MLYSSSDPDTFAGNAGSVRAGGEFLRYQDIIVVYSFRFSSADC